MSDTTAESLKHLIKEGSHNLRTYTKKGSVQKIAAECQGVQLFQSLGLSTPKIVHQTDTILTSEFVEGVSVFRALELLCGKHDKVAASILDELCRAVAMFQDNYQALKLDFAPYNVSDKVADIVEMLRESHPPMAEKVRGLVEPIGQYYDKARVPFRDASPQNHILRGISEDDLLRQRMECRGRIVHIDLGTVASLTFRADDYISVLFHYMIDKDTRNTLLREHLVDLDSEETIVAAFVRLGRFWVRRQYYKQYHPQAFIRRYRREDTGFYEALMLEYAEKAIQVLSSA